jgi:hypothetical protein
LNRYALLRFAAATLTLVASATGARAESPAAPSPGSAGDHFNEAMSLFRQGETASACRAFELSYREDAAPGTLFNMAVCHEKEGLFADAYRELDQLARRAEAVGRSEQAASIRARELSLQPKLARIDLVHRASPRAEVTGITLDTAPLLPEDWGRPLYVTPRVHTLHFRYADGSEQERTTGELTAGSVTALPVEQAAPPRPSSAATVAPARPPPVSPVRRTVAYAVGASGLALVAAGGVLGGLAFVKRHAADGDCPAGCMLPSQQKTAYQDRSDGKTYATFSTVGFSVGGAALVSSVVLFLTHGSSDTPRAGGAPSSAWSVTPEGHPGGAGLDLEGSF